MRVCEANSPLQAAMVQQAANAPQHTLSQAQNRKMTKYGELCRQAGVLFMPLETLACWHEVTIMKGAE